MESHKCKLCSRVFTNGRALGGHMKAHLTAAAAPPLPPPKPASTHVALPPSSSSSTAASDDLESEEKPTLYELRENPKRNFRFSDPVFDIVLQDRESETESKNPTRKRSKRCRKPPPESASSVSDTSPEEDLAMCLMMLSRDRRIDFENQNQIPNQKLFEKIEEIRVKKPIKRKKKCEKCTKQFRSYRALFSHEKICQLKTELEEEEEEESFRNGGMRRIFKCPFCFKLFGSGQALGGHKRSHLVSSTNGGVTTVHGSVSLKLKISLIDLNLPAPLEEDDYSVVSDA